MNWHIKHHCLEFEYFPHEEVRISKINWRKYPGAIMARWTENFDCKHQTEFWFCIKDAPFNIDVVKAKRRYEINKGIKNFYTQVINPVEYQEALYAVYCDSLMGYNGNPTPISREDFYKQTERWSMIKEQIMFGCFRRDNGQLCGYSDVYRRDPYLPISSLKTIPSAEREGVNFALIYGILEYFKSVLKEGAYICDGTRNIVHATHFQDFLLKYFDFRYAYCDLNVVYKFPFGFLIKVIFPFRKMIYHLCGMKLVPAGVKSILLQEAWRQGKSE